VTARAAQGHASRKQGFYGECVFQTIAAAANLIISRQLLEPDGIDFEVLQEKVGRRPRYKRIEVQVKTRSNVRRAADGDLLVSLRRKAYEALNGQVGEELDLPRFLVVVTVPKHFSDYCLLTGDQMNFANTAYFCNLMGEPDLPGAQDSVTVTVPAGNLLTPRALVELTCGDGREAELWMSA
jgi:hypothetical protein